MKIKLKAVVAAIAAAAVCLASPLCAYTQDTSLKSNIPAGTVLIPQASGITVYENEYAAIDASNIDQGYIMVKYKSASQDKIKVQITKSGGTVYNYNLSADGSYAVLPFTQGNGEYTVNVLKNVSDSKYSQVLGKKVTVSLKSELLPFTYPNQYVYFTSKSSSVAKAKELAQGADGQLGVVENIYNFVVNNIEYDYNKAKTVQSGYVANPDTTLASKTGICFDYASLMTAMLRSQAIPTKLIMGYTGTTYHAWISVYINDVGWVDNIISFDGKSWKLMDPTFASTGKGSSEAADYITNPSNYQEKYCY